MVASPNIAFQKQHIYNKNSAAYSKWKCTNKTEKLQKPRKYQTDKL